MVLLKVRGVEEGQGEVDVAGQRLVGAVAHAVHQAGDEVRCQRDDESLATAAGVEKSRHGT